MSVCVCYMCCVSVVSLYLFMYSCAFICVCECVCVCVSVCVFKAVYVPVSVWKVCVAWLYSCKDTCVIV